MSRKNFSTHNYFFIYLTITLLLEIYGYYMTSLEILDYVFFFNYYCLFGIIYFGHFYSRLFKTNSLKKVGYLICILTIGYCIFFTSIFSPLYDNKIGIVMASSYIIYSLLWFFQKMNNINTKKIIDDPNFWVSSGLLLWSTFFIFRTVPMYLFDKLDKDFLNSVVVIFNFVNCIMYSMFYISLMKLKKQPINE